MKSRNELNNELVDLYKEWAQQLDPTLTTDKYSNPYYVSIPDNWCVSANRIMIVGEEGAGGWGCGKTKDEKSKIAYNTKTWNAKNDIDKIQQYNREQIDYQCELYKIHNNKEWYENRGFTKNKVFWKRFKRIYDELGVPCIWNEIDKVHSVILRKNYKYKLLPKERENLHETKLKILMEEIRILQPTVVVFFGWHWKSLELENIELFQKCKKDWKKRITVIKGEINNKEINYVFTYHPNYKVVCNEQYEDELLFELKKLI